MTRLGLTNKILFIMLDNTEWSEFWDLNITVIRKTTCLLNLTEVYIVLSITILLLFFFVIEYNILITVFILL